MAKIPLRARRQYQLAARSCGHLSSFRGIWVLTLLIGSFGIDRVFGQEVADQQISLVAVVGDAEKNYPAIHVSQENLNASIANLTLACTAYLPRLDGVAQF